MTLDCCISDNKAKAIIVKLLDINFKVQLALFGSKLFALFSWHLLALSAKHIGWKVGRTKLPFGSG